MALCWASDGVVVLSKTTRGSCRRGGGAAACVGLWRRGGGGSPCHGNTGGVPHGDGSGKPDRAGYRETGAISISFGDIRTHCGGDTGRRHSFASGDTNGSVSDACRCSLADGDTLPNPQPDGTGSRSRTDTCSRGAGGRADADDIIDEPAAGGGLHPAEPSH